MLHLSVPRGFLTRGPELGARFGVFACLLYGVFLFGGAVAVPIVFVAPTIFPYDLFLS